MASDIVIPKLGMTMTQATISKWEAAEGDRIEKKQIVLIIETEKVTYEVEAFSSGFLHIIAGPGTVAEVGVVVGKLAETEAELAVLQAEQPSVSETTPASTTTAATQTTAAQATSAVSRTRSGKIRISPKAKKIAKAHNIDYSRLQGSGTSGRIIQKDIEAAIAAGPHVSSVDSAGTAGEQFSGEIIDGKKVKKTIPLGGMRQAIAEHMLHSLQVSAQLSTGTEVEMTEIIRMRNSLKKKAELRGQRLTFTDIFVYILAAVLKEQPIMNSSLIDGKIILWEDVNIGVATSLQLNDQESGLAVPVVRDADKKSLFQLGQSINELVEKTRSGKMALDDMLGGTFTLTNTGVFGSRWSWATPVINQPQTAILQTGGITDRPVVVDGEVVARPMMPLILTFDHRVVDGAPAGMFLGRLVEIMEDPYQLLE